MEESKSCSVPIERKRKLEEVDDSDSVDNKTLFEDFHVVKILNENAQQKSFFVHGRFGETTSDAVLILEKTPFSEDNVSDMLKCLTEIKCGMQNDIYRTLELYPKPEYNGIKSTLIYPATEKHLLKYSAQKSVIVSESPDDYLNIVRPFIDNSSFSRQWVYNVLDKQSEVDRLLLEDNDVHTGFMLFPDMKWDGKQIEDLYVVAFPLDRSLHSLRDLTAQHIPLLQNIRDKCLATIKSKYGLDRHSVRVYLHYLPSYYHLHIHFTHIQYDAPGIVVGRAHLLDDVIDNLQLAPDWYQRKTLTYLLRETDELYRLYKQANKIQN